MERIKLKMLLMKYENELRKGNAEHIKDYIGARVVLALSLSPGIIDSRAISKTTLNSLICPFDLIGGKIIDYKVPSLQSIYYLQNKYNLYYKKHYGIPVNMIQENGAATWIGLMIENGMVSEGDTINLTQFKLIDFISDPKLKNIMGITEMVEVDNNLIGDNKIIYDNEIQCKSNIQKVKLTKTKRR